MARSNRFNRHKSLSVLPLEDRLTPATSVFSAGTLTVFPAANEAIVVSLNSSLIPGYLRVTANGNPVFDSVANQPVYNLAIKGGGVSNYSLNFNPDVTLSSLNVVGASSATTVTLAPTTRVNGNFSFTGSPSGNGDDAVTLSPGSRIGGTATINLKNGTNTANLSGTVGKDLIVFGGNGADVFNLGFGTLTLGGGLGITGGNGPNQVLSRGASLFVGKNFNYTGGSDDDAINVTTSNFLIGGNANVGLGGANSGNSWFSTALFVGGNFSATGGFGNDTVQFQGGTQVGGYLSASLSGGTNSLAIGYNGGSSTVIGAGLTYSGGSGNDGVFLDNIAIAGGTSLSLGDGGGVPQGAFLGTRQGALVDIGNSLSITGGNDIEDIRIFNVDIGGNLNVTTNGGNDVVQVDDTDISGAANFNLGIGNDTLAIDTRANNGNGTNLPGIVRIGAAMTVYGGDGDDLVDLSNATGNGVRIGGNVKLFGGQGANDTFVHRFPGNVYLQSTFEDFDTGESF